MIKPKKKKSESQLKKSTIEEQYIKLTESNRKALITIGRIIHVIVPHGKETVNRIGQWPIRPRFVRGWIDMENDPSCPSFSVFCFEDEDPIQYKESFSELLDSGIKKEQLFIKKNQPLVTFKHREIKTYENKV